MAALAAWTDPGKPGYLIPMYTIIIFIKNNIISTYLKNIAVHVDDHKSIYITDSRSNK